MDFSWSSEDDALRQDVRAFVKREWDSHGLDSHSNSVYSYDVHVVEDGDRIEAFAKKLVTQGWYTMGWPQEFGGQEAPMGRRLAYHEEMAYAGAPVDSPGFFAHTLMIHGQQWQKDTFLKEIAAGGMINLSQGFSEPNSGADLASVRTRAVRDGDDWLITGQKIWNTGGHLADWGHYLVRSDPDAPKHRGISYFMLDMKTPGITLRPLYDALGRFRWCEVFLDNVRVPDRNIIGEVNRGWYAAMTNMSFERGGVAAPARRLRDLEQFMAYGRRTKIDGRPIIGDVVSRHLLADARIQIEIGRMISYRVAWAQTKGEVPVMESSFSKLFNDEMTWTIYNIFRRILKDSSVLIVGDPRAPLRGYPAVNAYLSGMNRFAGGGKEIMYNIIAQRGLGLPR
ncbi:MAG: acyl-CoA dehydrogenase family protein [Chloroflexi bacterium]|nr:acyl-CoA dehydrogenase family protein [Chloroflexota bacterium]